MPGIPSSSGAASAGPKVGQTAWGARNVHDCRCRCLCSKSARSRRHSCTTKRPNYTGRRPSGSSSRMPSGREKRQRGNARSATRSSATPDPQSVPRSKKGLLSSHPRIGFGTRRRTGKSTTTTRERTTRRLGWGLASDACATRAWMGRLGPCRRELPAESLLGA